MFHQNNKSCHLSLLEMIKTILFKKLELCYKLKIQTFHDSKQYKAAYVPFNSEQNYGDYPVEHKYLPPPIIIFDFSY